MSDAAATPPPATTADCEAPPPPAEIVIDRLLGQVRGLMIEAEKIGGPPPDERTECDRHDALLEVALALAGPWNPTGSFDRHAAARRLAVRALGWLCLYAYKKTPGAFDEMIEELIKWRDHAAAQHAAAHDKRKTAGAQ